MQNDSRNTIIFVVCALFIFIAYNFLVLEPAAKKRQAAAQAHAAQTMAAKPGQQPGAAVDTTFVPRAQAEAASPRLRIDSQSLSGSVALTGARLDDLYLKAYHVTPDKASPMVELLRPKGAEHAYFAEMGWTGANIAGLPGGQTPWTPAQPGAVLTQTSPLVLTYDNGAGLKFTRTITVDKDFMFTVTDQVANTGAAPATITPYASLQRQGVPAIMGHAHEGAIGVLGDRLKQIKYKAWKKDGGLSLDSTGGWLGITDQYWMAALVPTQGEALKATFRVTSSGPIDIYEAAYLGAPKTVQPGQSVTEVTRLFAGAKTVPLLQYYKKTLGIPRFEFAVDWGTLWFFTQPLFQVLEFFYHHIGNFGLAILALTVLVKLVFFPLANKSYESMTKMKKLQPMMEDIKQRFPGDTARQQQETMALYQREKINPISGCLPMLATIPVFLALFKLLNVTIEMRHAPFFGWIHDLSARDPSTIWTLFGLIPWNPALVPFLGQFLDGPLHIGVWPLLYGFTMWLTQSMNPPAPDPTQQRIFQLMPIIFTFTLSQFAVGLMIYYTWSNLLTIVQQYVIMRRFGVDNPIDKMIGRLTGKAATG